MSKDLKALAKGQMSGPERLGRGSALSVLSRRLDGDERVESLFGGQIKGKPAVIALTDRRLLASCGLTGRSDSIDYAAIGQVTTGLTKVVIRGAGVDLEVKSVARKDELVNALNRRRAGGPASPTPPSDRAADDLNTLLRQLAALLAAGILTDEEFSAKKAALIERM